MLHVLNGESTAQTLKQSGLAGEHLVWKEALIWGPTPGNLSLPEWCRLRADFLAGAISMDAQQCFEDLMQQEAMSGNAGEVMTKWCSGLSLTCFASST